MFDEADRLLLDRVSFEFQVSRILAVLPKQRRTGLFSATLSAETSSLFKSGMRDAVLIRVLVQQANQSESVFPEQNTSNISDESIVAQMPNSLTNYVAVLPRKYKLSFLLKFLLTEVITPNPDGKGSRGKKCIIFFLTCSCVNFAYKIVSKMQSRSLCSWFSKDAVVVRLYGKMKQKTRIASYKKFADSPLEKPAILIATDVAARGLDFPNVEWIVQFDPPLV